MKNIFRLNSLRKKFILVVTALLLGVFIIDGVIAISNNIKVTRKNLSEQAIAFAQLSTKPLAESYDLYFDSGYYKFRELFDNILKLDVNIKKIQFIDVNGKIILDSTYIGESSYQGTQTTSVSPEIIEKVVSDEPVYMTNPKIDQEVTEIFYPYYTDWGSHPFTVVYFISYDQIRENIISIITQTIILILIFFIFSVALVTGVLNRLILAPITIVSQVAQKISKGKYGERIKVETNDEIEELADAANKMAYTLEQNIIALKELDKLKDEFIDIAAHNLKIPLNHLKFDIDYLLKKLKAKINKKDYELLKDIEINQNKLNLLSEDLINITAIREDTFQTSVFMPFDLVQIVKEAIRDIEPAINLKNLSLKTNFLKSAPILGDGPKLKSVFLNIIDNAIKYSDKNPSLRSGTLLLRNKKGNIAVNLRESKDGYVVEISDSGVGMRKEEIPKLFQKFYRAPSSAQYDPSGTGLGLYLAKLIIDVHHGKIWAESEPGKGSKFSVSLLKKDIFRERYPFK